MADLTEFFRIELIIVSVALTPVIMIVAFGLGMKSSDMLVENIPYFLFVAPGIFALGTMFSSTFSAGYTIISDRQRRLISSLVLSPVSYSSFVVARIISTIFKSATQLIVTLLVAILFVGIPLVRPLFFMLGFILTAIFFAGVGMIFGSFSNALTFQGLANIVLVPSMFFCGVFFPVSNFKQIATLIYFLPFTIGIEIFRYGITGRLLGGSIFNNLALLVIYDIVAVFVGIVVFKRAVTRR